MLLWNDEWLAAMLVAVRRRPNSSQILRGVVPFWAYYDKDEEGEREKVFVHYVSREIVHITAKSGEKIPWRSCLARSAGELRNDNGNVEGCVTPEANPAYRRRSDASIVDNRNERASYLSGCCEGLKVLKASLWKLGDACSLQQILKFPLRSRSSRRPRLGVTNVATSPLLESGFACVGSSLTLETAINLSRSHPSLIFLSRTSNFSFSGAFSSTTGSGRPLHSFESGNQIMNSFFTEGNGPRPRPVCNSSP